MQPWDLDQFRNGDAKIGAFRLVDAEKPEAMAVLAELESVDRSYRQQLANTGHLIAYEKRRGISVIKIHFEFFKMSFKFKNAVFDRQPKP